MIRLWLILTRAGGDSTTLGTTTTALVHPHVVRIPKVVGQ